VPRERIVKRNQKKSFQQRKFPSSYKVMDFLPNMITVVALCTGLTSIRFAWDGLWEMAVISILVAAVLDAMDGRLARFLGSASDFGAELDSLSDFLCFGVAPAALIYAFSFAHWRGIGWAFSLLFATCSALRLARFNVHRLTLTKISWGANFSIGVPAPAGAFIALLPFMLFFTSGISVISPWFFGFSMTLSALLMISRIPTFLLKNMKLSRRKMAFALLLVVLLTAGLFTYPWGTLMCIGLFYVFSIPLSLIYILRLKNLNKKSLSSEES
jgi:CDP-diacylglycerol--serine O-phosphatidyltransferase